MPMFDELKQFKFWKAVRTEFLASVLLIVIGCGSIMTSHDYEHTSTDSRHSIVGVEEVKVGLAFGLCVTVLSQCVGVVSGAHLNPAVSLALLVSRHVSLARCLCYMCAQCAGAVCGAAILYGVGPGGVAQRDLGVTRLATNLSGVQGFGVEFFASFLYVFSYLANVDPKKQEPGPRALYIGLTLTLVHLFGYRLTGASTNPARSLGPAVIMNQWNDHWIYWISPMLGGFFAALTYEYTEESSLSWDTVRRHFGGGGGPPPPLDSGPPLHPLRSLVQLHPASRLEERQVVVSDGVATLPVDEPHQIVSRTHSFTSNASTDITMATSTGDGGGRFSYAGDNSSSHLVH